MTVWFEGLAAEDVEIQDVILVRVGQEVERDSGKVDLGAGVVVA
jgi:hypothetical protein